MRRARVNRSCSTFLAVMLYWQASFGGAMPAFGTGVVPGDLRKKLDKAWDFVGEVNQTRAYGQPGRALCMLKWIDGWRMFVGGTSGDDINAVAKDLNLGFDG